MLQGETAPKVHGGKYYALSSDGVKAGKNNRLTRVENKTMFISVIPLPCVFLALCLTSGIDREASRWAIRRWSPSLINGSVISGVLVNDTVNSRLWASCRSAG